MYDMTSIVHTHSDVPEAPDSGRLIRPGGTLRLRASDGYRKMAYIS
jgi:hypothetical protein